MLELSKFWSVLCLILVSSGVSSFVKALSGSDDLPAAHFEPQVAVLCDGKGSYHIQYMTESGRWVSDSESKAVCMKEKLEILEYCKKVYPKRDITNIVESSRRVKIPNWCRVGNKKCKVTRAVKPYRCLEGPFQSDALLVPEHCVFDHIHNQTDCWELSRWNQRAAHSCRDREMQLESFAMLLPCGVSVFSGVEFVCCPKHPKETKPRKLMEHLALKSKAVPLDTELPVSDAAQNLDSSNVVPKKSYGEDAGIVDGDDDDDDDDEDDEDERDDYEDDEEEDDEDDDDDVLDNDDLDFKETTTASTSVPSSSSVPSTPSVPTRDPYLSHFDPRNEHQAFKDAQQRLEELHREKVTKVMKDWSDLEDRYQEMRSNDPRAAEDFKKKMTVRFQKTVQALEEEGDAEKHQLVTMHQQRVMAHINERKKEAMTCYTQSLNESPPNTHKVQKCLQKLLRALHKDRHHTIAHFRHLLTSSLEQAEREKGITLEHLIDIDRMVNQSLQMLDRFPELSTKLRQLMEDYLQALRSKDDTPSPLLAMTREAESAILDKYRAEIAARQEEKEHQRELERQRKEQRKKERESLREERRRVEAAMSHGDGTVGHKLARPFDPETMEDEHAPVASPSSSVPPSVAPSLIKPHQQEAVKVAHAQLHDVGHQESSYSVRREVYHRENKSIYFTLAFAGIALMAALIVGIAVLRRRNSRSPHNQGFVEVDQAATPEERHVANMQINGYENPTYKYFEAKE